MIDLHTYECVKLEDVAEYGRAKQGHIYPRGASTLQISATRGQLNYLEVPQEVHSKEVVVIPQAGINSRYFNIVMQKNIDRFLKRYATGINIQEREVGNFPIELHNQDTQEAIVKMFDIADREEREAQEELAALLEMKKTLLDAMMI